jgi:hypothetical protein
MATCLRGGPRAVHEFPAASAVIANMETFDDAVAGKAPYPVTNAKLVGTIAALEAVFTSVRQGGTVETVAG